VHFPGCWWDVYFEEEHTIESLKWKTGDLGSDGWDMKGWEIIGFDDMGTTETLTVVPDVTVNNDMPGSNYQWSECIDF